ncbi:hypothetical protein [aff. Roholtiella sp. LEGE 12411]|uniref:hypothetical protein n=1 Tax=aff. Roholtiella sp. LEGE 12411 TaxID=1828822 RepID=UPI001882E180|nr:hypothetical protein [aff. Roholtiella sp. LEGE 12411]MBE9038333.1 hypothetical protein [aff. Roholtiella sp. LEGE 12411]
MKKRYFFDTEFDEDGTTINLISIGIVCELFGALVSELELAKAMEPGTVQRTLCQGRSHLHPANGICVRAR